MVLDIDATLRLLIKNANCFSFFQNSYFFLCHKSLFEPHRRHYGIFHPEATNFGNLFLILPIQKRKQRAFLSN